MCGLLLVSQLSQQPGPRPSRRSHVGLSPAVCYATEPRATSTRTPLTRTVRTTCLTCTRSSPTPSETAALTGIPSWAPSQKAARPPPRHLRLDPSTTENCSQTPRSRPRAARGARAVRRATARRFPQTDMTVRCKHGC